MEKLKPESDPISGRKYYKGSIADQSGGELSDKQRKAVLESMREGPVFASKLSEAAQISQFNPHAQQGLALHLSDLLKQGLATFSGKRGWSLTPKGLELLPQPEDKE
jgi:hypothetical protein